MIKRYRTRCLTCGHKNTLRITLGTEPRQEHTFGCAGCGEDVTVALALDFINRETYEFIPGKKLTFPTPTFTAIGNCELCDQEGTITNLDPNFLVPEEMAHKDQVFTWMYAVRKGNIAPKSATAARQKAPTAGKPVIVDILDEIGIPRLMSTAIQAFCRVWRFHRRNQGELASQQLTEIEKVAGVPVKDVWTAAMVLAMGFLGKRLTSESQTLIREIRAIRKLNESEYQRFRTFVLDQQLLDDGIDRQVDVLGDYLRGIDQFNQTWIYASSNEPATDAVVASSSDLRTVRLFYGGAFEQLATALTWPACLNNIKNGRPYDAFQTMTLAKYRTIDKAKRASPFADNAAFSITHDEFDSTLRNASHHAAVRLATNSREILEYRSGDTGQWKRMRYSAYLLKCNRIQMCLLRLLLMQIWIGRGFD